MRGLDQQKFQTRVYQVIGLVAVVVVVGASLSACNPIRRLGKSDPEVALKLPPKAASALPERSDTMRAEKIISFRRQDGTEVFFAPAAIDSATGEKLMSVSIDEVVISARSRRNLVERNGKIDVEFIVTVPPAILSKNWQVALTPRMTKGADTLTFSPLIFSGERFRIMQEREYARYADYCDEIVDSAYYFDAFGNKQAFNRALREAALRRQLHAENYDLLENNTPQLAEMNRRVGWITPQERRRQYALLRQYVRATDRKVARYTLYTPMENDPFDHLNDYLTPRYRFSDAEVLPGGRIYTRVQGQYPDSADQARESYFRRLAASRRAVRSEVAQSPNPVVSNLAEERLRYTGLERPMIEGLCREMSDSALRANYAIRKLFEARQVELLSSLDTAAMIRDVLHWGKIARNEELAADSSMMFQRLVRNPYNPNARVDTVIRRVDGSVQYYYTQQVTADENTSKLLLFLNGGAEDRNGRAYRLQKTDTLTYNVASMTSFLDETPRYMQRIQLRDAEANARFYFTFPSGRSNLVDTLTANRQQLRAVRELTRSLMTDPVYIIDSITLRATSSPEGSWSLNDRLAHERAEALRRVLLSEFRVLYDSLKVSANYTLDDQGRVVAEKADERLPDLPNILRTKWLAEDWERLHQLIVADDGMPDKQAVLTLIAQIHDADSREWRIRNNYPKAYERMSRVFYPQMRAVDFRFNLHRRGMLQDTVYTTEIDSNYMHAVELLKKRRYEEALSILRPYEDRNTALAYMSVGHDAAAFRILRGHPDAATTADIQYMLAILAARLGNEEQAVQYFLRSTELRSNLKFRGNLDPEISDLIRKYGLFREDFQ